MVFAGIIFFIASGLRDSASQELLLRFVYVSFLCILFLISGSLFKIRDLEFCINSNFSYARYAEKLLTQI